MDNDYIGLSTACKLMRGRRGKPAHKETVRRWAGAGCYPCGKGGPRIVLLTIRLNGELLTTAEWVGAFERERIRYGSRTGRGPTT